MNGLIIDYGRIFDDPWCNPRWLFKPISGKKKKKCLFLFLWINVLSILLFSWDLELTLCDIPKDVVFEEILVFNNTFGVRVVN